MAAFTIGYTPQFIQSDIGAIQKRFADMQSQYDLGYQQSLEAEDAFSAIPTITAEDAAIKEDVLGGFKNRVQGIVDEYGGDYGAAAKRLAKEIISTKSNPFFTAAMLKAQRAEEQRKLASQPGAIILKDVTKTPLRDAQGNYVTADQLDYSVTTRDAIRRELGLAYADLAKKVTEGDYQSVKGVPWLLQKAVTRGITQEEVPAVAENMIATVKQMHPELSDDIAQSIALEQANQLVMGTQTQETSNWQYQQDYNFGQQKDMYKWQLDEKANRETEQRDNFLKQDRSRQYLTEDPQYKDKEKTLSKITTPFTDTYTGKTYNNPFEAKQELDKMKKQQSFYTKERERIKKAYNINAFGIPEKRVELKDGLVTGPDSKYYANNTAEWYKQRDARLIQYQKDIAKLERDEKSFKNKVESLEKTFKGYILSDKEFNSALKLYELPENASYNELIKHATSNKTLVDNKVIDLNATNNAGNTLKSDMVGSALRYINSTAAPKKITIKEINGKLNNAKSKDITKEKLAELLNPDNVDAISLAPGFIENNELLIQGIDGEIIAVPARIFGSQVEGIMDTPIINPTTGERIGTYKDYYKQLRKNNDLGGMTEFENVVSEKIANKFNYNFYQMQGNTAKQE